MNIIENPFVAGQPVFGQNFIDRYDVVKKIEYFLISKKKHSFIIFGQRRIGKTSLLRHIDFIYRNNSNFITSYINLQNFIDQDAILLWQTIKKQIIDDIGIKNNFQNTKLIDFLIEVSQIINKTIIILFDEFDAMYNYENAKRDATKAQYKLFYSLLKHISQKELPIKIIFAISPGFKNAETQYYSKLIGLGTKFNLNFFQPIRTEELLKLAEPKLFFTQKAVKYIYYLTAGHPFYTQCIAASCFKYAILNNLQTIDIEQVKKNTLISLKTYSSNFLWIWESLHKWQKILIFIITNLKFQKQNTFFYNIVKEYSIFKVTISENELSELIEIMLKYKYIKQFKGQYYIKSKLLLFWVKQNIEKNKIW